jgi:hypothetical protein
MDIVDSSSHTNDNPQSSTEEIEGHTKPEGSHQPTKKEKRGVIYLSSIPEGELQHVNNMPDDDVFLSIRPQD